VRQMNRRAAKAILASSVAVASLILAPQSASAIDMVECNGISEYVHMDMHYNYNFGWSVTRPCFANSGEHSFEVSGRTYWVDEIWTGNNRVQWYGDGKWQPETPIGKWTTFNWPNYPGGVRIDKIRIL